MEEHSVLGYLELGTKRPLRVAAYCRISFEEEQVEGSFENQKAFFEKEIRLHDGWELAGIFGDYAKTGTQIRGRTDFERMKRRAEAGTIDYILTKSISRFSRNAADTLYALREFTSLGVGVYFMEQSLDSLSGMGDIVLTGLASIAEMESQSISENVKNTFNNMNKKGTPLRKAAYGYRKEGTTWMVDEDQAFRIKLAFWMISNMFPFKAIADRLNQIEDIARTGRNWTYKMVKNILTNEACIGTVITNKNVTVWEEDGKKEVVNSAIQDKANIIAHHKPVVGEALFEKVQEYNEQKLLPGQVNYHGARARNAQKTLKAIASRDHQLDDVRDYLPLNGQKKPSWD